ncbi:hypothetical protein HanOQP8_Chr00c660g0847671 [Helianthus annuus]|nr:hypothetical protein HanOQP8_Chr00c660g0847671 [Helianthus annuus]
MALQASLLPSAITVHKEGNGAFVLKNVKSDFSPLLIGTKVLFLSSF